MIIVVSFDNNNNNERMNPCPGPSTSGLGERQANAPAVSQGAMLQGHEDQ